LHENDVLFGRGSGYSQHIGNRRFRDLCEERKTRYNATIERSIKVDIAQEIVTCVHSRGGRFLKLKDSGGAVDYVIENGVWYEVGDKEAMEKTKQALRQKGNSRENSHKRAALPITSTTASGSFDGLGILSLTVPVASTPATWPASALHQPALYPPPAAANVLPVLPPSLVANASPDPRLSLFQSSDPLTIYMMLFEQQALGYTTAAAAESVPGAEHATLPLLNVQSFDCAIPPTEKASLSLPDLSLYTNSTMAHQQLLDMSPRQATPTVQEELHGFSPSQALLIASPDEKNVTSYNNGHSQDEDTVPLAESTPNLKEEVPRVESASVSTEVSMPVDEDFSEFLTSVLLLSGLPRFTAHAQEKANMTDEERAAALSDMFGKYCNVDSQKNKKARRDLDEDSVAFLVKHMRAYLKRIPKGKKHALMEAQQQCGAEEFRDKRLERFLRCEGMNAEKAAKRFVNYWESRRELFGEEKYLMPMTLSGALCDDLVALEVGWLCLLPKLDESGRQLLYMEPARHKREGYTTESMVSETCFFLTFLHLFYHFSHSHGNRQLRAAWYVAEVASQTNHDIDSGVVQIVWGKNSTVWDYDHQLYTKYAKYESSCWPCKFDCFHDCLAPDFICQVVVPIYSAFQSRQSRIRTISHDVPESKILWALSVYGITADMLPTEFGGTIQFDQSEWIAQRRAEEMEEL